MPKPAGSSNTSDKYLSLRAKRNARLGKALAYLQSLDINTNPIASQTLEARFLPFAIDKNDPEFLAIALQCAAECEAWGKAIREYAGFSNGTNTSPHNLDLYPTFSPPFPSESSITHLHERQEEIARRQSLVEEQNLQAQEDLITSMGLV
jgi:hypothetical protein